MKALIRTQLKSLFNIRLIMSGLIIGLLLGIIQALLLKHELLIQEIEGTIVDFFLFSLGGWRVPMNILAFIQWLTVILIVLLVSQWSYSNASNIVLVTRFKNRVIWWLSHCFSQLLISILSLVVLILGHFIAGWLFFSHRLEWGFYSFRQFPFTEKYSPFIYLIMAFCILFSGFYVLILMQMIVKIIFSTESAPMTLFLSMIPLGFAYIYNQLPYALSPFFYPSFTNPVHNSIQSSLFFNIGLSALFIVLGMMVVRVKDLR